MKWNNSNGDTLDILDVICTKHGICTDIKNIIYNYSLNSLNSKQKNDINQLHPLLQNIQINEDYDAYLKFMTSKLFFKLPHKYKKGFLLYLKYDIYIHATEHTYAIQFALQHFRDIVSYIGNRNELIHTEVFEFVCFYYGEFGFNPPTQVKFRSLMRILTEYFYIKGYDDIV